MIHCEKKTLRRPREWQDTWLVIGTFESGIGIAGHIAVAVVGVFLIEVGKVGEVHGALGYDVAVGVGDFPKI